MRKVQIGEKQEISVEHPGEYELILMNLISSPIRTSDGLFRNKSYSLMLMYSNFSVYEDLHSNCLSGSISIVDSNSMLTEFPIIGDELIEIMFRSMNTDISIYLKFRVVEISEIDSINDLTKAYTLLLSSPISIRSEKQKISRSFAGIDHKTHHIIQQICEDNLNLKNEKDVPVKQIGDYNIRDKKLEEDYYRIESMSGHSEKYVAPYKSPFSVINTLCKRSVNSSGSMYYFFEDINCFRFFNLEENSRVKKNRPPVRELVYYPGNAIDRTAVNLEMYWSVAETYAVKKRFNVFENMSRGMYSSEVTFLDIEKRKAITKNYYYQHEGAEYNHTSDGYLLTSKYSDLIHNRDFESPATVQSVVPFHTGDFQSQDYTLHLEEYFQRRMSMEAQANAIVLEVQIPGDSTGEISLGEFVNFSILSVDPKDDNSIITDPYLSGNYMVTRIHHHISKGTNRYSMILELISDTVFQEYDLSPEKEFSDIESVSIQAQDKNVELTNDQEKVQTSSISNVINDAIHFPTRKRAISKLGIVITEKDKQNV